MPFCNDLFIKIVSDCTSSCFKYFKCDDDLLSCPELVFFRLSVSIVFMISCVLVGAINIGL